MVLPLFKVMSIAIRMLSRPLINKTKQAHLQNDAANNKFRTFFIRMGNWYNQWQAWINRKFMKIQTQLAYKPLSDELAVEKGIEFFYEIIFYLIVIGLPVYQLYKGSVEAQQKSIKLSQTIKSLQQQNKSILKQIREVKSQLKSLKESQKKPIVDHGIMGAKLCQNDLKFIIEEASKTHVYHLCYI